MKIAVAAMGKNVAGHFGHCENFIFFGTADGGITGVNSVPNPGHRPGFLPNFLADNGAGVVIAGSVGGGAVDIFGKRGSWESRATLRRRWRPTSGASWSPAALSATSTSTPASAESISNQASAKG